MGNMKRQNEAITDAVLDAFASKMSRGQLKMMRPDVLAAVDDVLAAVEKTNKWAEPEPIRIDPVSDAVTA